MTNPVQQNDDTNGESLSSRLNWLRAAVLGANDGIVSTGSIVVGVSAADVGSTALLAAGVSGMVAGALSMAAGEYVSVSTQRDTEQAALQREREELREDPEGEFEELANYFVNEGIPLDLAHKVSEELTKKSALDAHARFELGIDPTHLTNPWAAAASSFVSFLAGAIIPLVAIIASPGSLAVLLTMIASALALALTGSVSAQLGGAPIGPATIRNIAGGTVAMAATYLVGMIIGS